MEFDPVERSFHNDAEADAVKRVYDGLRRRMTMDKIRVVTPFRAQTDELKTRITGMDKEKLRGSAGSQTLGREGRSDKLEQEDTIDTIDKFQGSEAPVVVLSPVAPRGGKLHRAQDPHLPPPCQCEINTRSSAASGVFGIGNSVCNAVPDFFSAPGDGD